MVERGWGRIVNVSSIIGCKGGFGQTNYAAAKAGMHGLKWTQKMRQAFKLSS
jgi:acetoacetyl-CoA reductase